MVKDEQTDAEAARQSIIYRVTNEIVNSISMTSGFLVICAIFYLKYKHKKDRVSLRLQTYISLNDMFFAAFQIMTVNSIPPGNWVCRVSPWGFVFTALLGCFLTAMLAFNLQIIFVYNYLNTKRFEKFYVIIPLALSFTLSIIPVLAGELGFDEKEVSCWYKNGNTTKAIVWEWTTLHGWIVLTVIYCIYSIFTIINRLYKANKFIEEMNRSLSGVTNSGDKNNNKDLNRNSLYFFKSSINKSLYNNNHQRYAYKRQLMVNRAVKRIVLYPIVPVITYMFNITSSLLFFTSNSNHFYFQMLSNVGLGLQGFFNALAFSFDPAMKTVWSEIFNIRYEEDFDINNNVDIREKINYAVISSDSNTIVINDDNIINNNIIVNVDQSIGYDNHHVSLSFGDNNNNGDNNNGDNNNNNSDNSSSDNSSSDNSNNDDGNNNNNYDYDFDDMTVVRFSRASKDAGDEKYIITLL